MKTGWMGRALLGTMVFLMLGTGTSQAADQVQMVKDQIQDARSRLAEDKAKLLELSTRFQKTPDASTYGEVIALRERIQKRQNVVSLLNAALRDARAAQSWTALVQDMVKESTVLSAGANALSVVYSAGSWIFGASDEEIFGQSWQETESLNARLVEEARKVREESRMILGALSELNKQIQSGQSSDEISRLALDLNKRFLELRERAEKIRKNLHFMIRVYKAEKQNLPPSTMFWGKYMGRYIEQVLAEIDLAKLTDFVLNLAEGDIVSPLVELVKPMIKTAMADVLASMAGGSALTPEITDDLVFSILFKSNSGFAHLATEKAKGAAGKAAMNGIATGVIQAEAQVYLGKSTKMFYKFVRDEVADLPPTATVDEINYIRDAWAKKGKIDASKIQAAASEKLDRMKKSGAVIKKLWDLVFKDIVQAMLNADTFKETVKKANEACKGWRKYYKENQDDMIATEDEYVNSKWFSGMRTLPDPSMPAGIPDPLETVKEKSANYNLDKAAEVIGDMRESIKENETNPEGQGRMSLSEVQALETSMFNLITAGTMPSSKMTLLDPVALARVTESQPCVDLGKKNSAIYRRMSDACKPLFKASTMPQYERCTASARAFGQKMQKESNACYEKVHQAYKAFAENRVGYLNEIYAKVIEDEQARLAEARALVEPLRNWGKTHASLFEELKKRSESLPAHAEISVDSFPELPADFKAETITAADYDTVRNEERLAQMRRGLSQVNGAFDPDPALAALDEVDWEPNTFMTAWNISQRIVNPVELPSKFEVNAGFKSLHQIYAPSVGPVWTCTGAGCVVQPSAMEPIGSIAEREKMTREMAANPTDLRRVLDSIMYHPMIGRRDEVERLSKLSTAKAVSLYKEGIAAYNNLVSQYLTTRGVFDSVAESAAIPAGVSEINSFYMNTFQPWKIIRRANPKSASDRLRMDTDEFAQKIEEFTKKFEASRQGTVLKDPDKLKLETMHLKSASETYAKAIEEYDGYLGQFFMDRKADEFRGVSVTDFEVRAVTLPIENEAAQSAFKTAADALKEMREALKEMKKADQELLAERRRVNSAQAAAVSKAREAAARYPDDPKKVLQAVSEASKDLESVGSRYIVLDHRMTESMQKEMANTRSAVWGELEAIREKFTALLDKKKKQERFSGYEIRNARINGYSTDSAYGEVVLMPDQLREGKIVVTGDLTHADGIKKMLFSEDGGRTWNEVGVNHFFAYEIIPFSEKRYEPVLKIETELLETFELPVFQNIRAVVFRDVRYTDLVTAATLKLAEAYERQDVNAFSELIARDYLGNKVFLTEGVRFDFDMFADTRLKIFIDRIEKRGDLYVAETRWQKSQTPRITGQTQTTTGSTVMVYVLEDGVMKIKNLRGNLIYATLSPEIAEASGLPSATVDAIREARDERTPTQPGAGETRDAGGVTSTAYATPVTGTGTMIDGGNGDGFSFVSLSTVNDPVSDIYLEEDIMWPNGNARIQTATQSYDAITEAPLSGYLNDAVNNAAGEVFIFTTDAGEYGKMEILTADGGAGGTTTFKYAVQRDGSRYLKTS
ncbi:MAG: hypothetical protein HQL11_02455 [Candidatus Omnitrophica bacterium]|nr:hypothetical protein [Candidatus Omnitrophota bacterium]